MYRHVNRLVIIPVVIVIVFATLLAPVSAKSVRSEYRVERVINAAYGFWDLIVNGDTVNIEIEVIDTKERGFPRSIFFGIYVWVWEDGPGEDPTYNEYTMTLSPSEYRWNWVVGYCQVSTALTIEEDGETFEVPVSVEWNTEPPITPDEWDDGDYKEITEIKDGTAALTTIEGPFAEEVTYDTTTALMLIKTQMWKK